MKPKQGGKVRQFPPITKQKALEIAAQVCGGDHEVFHCYNKKPKGCAIYMVTPIPENEPCWYVYTSWDKNPGVLRSSRVIVISRLTGKVYYDVSAGDEG